jgi:glycosyltransferase involved in cell wall biosynthesis
MEVGMSQEPRADVILAADSDPTQLEGRLQAMLAHSGRALRKLIVINDEPARSEMSAMLERLAQTDPRVDILDRTSTSGRVGSFNCGLAERAGDAVVLSSDCIVGDGWLAALATVAHAEQRTACAFPLMTGTGAGSVPVKCGAMNSSVSAAIVGTACTGLPSWTASPNVAGPCAYLRGDVVDAVGLFDDRCASLELALRDWVRRASFLGFGAARANHSYVHFSSSDDAVSHEHSPTALHCPDVEPALDRFNQTLDGQLAAHAVRVQSTGKIRVAFDIRHLPREQVGTRTYAVGLGQALGALDDIELTLLVREPAQAAGLKGRVVTADEWSDDVEVIHKPAQVVVPAELKLLFESSAHVVITYQDLIGYQIPSVFPTDFQHERYVGTSSLSLQAVQRVIAYSQSAGHEITAAFGIPAEEIGVVALGVEAGWFAQREPGDHAILQKLGLPTRFFFSIATDFPHKNLPNLLEAYATLRRRWRNGEPPGLVLAGHTSSARTDFYPTLESSALPDGVTTLGPVTREQLRVLYQRAMALVFPSLYEGFGLPPLEAMAAGTPVIAMPISAVPEVGGDAVLYADGLSVPALARAMESIATDEGLRTELRDRGQKRVDAFRWEQTARATAQIYRSAVHYPSERSLRMRRLLQSAIVRWSESRPADALLDCYDDYDLFMLTHPVGIRNALRALNTSLQARLRRELKRLHSSTGRRSA